MSYSNTPKYASDTSMYMRMLRDLDTCTGKDISDAAYEWSYSTFYTMYLYGMKPGWLTPKQITRRDGFHFLNLHSFLCAHPAYKSVSHISYGQIPNPPPRPRAHPNLCFYCCLKHFLYVFSGPLAPGSFLIVFAFFTRCLQFVVTFLLVLGFCHMSNGKYWVIH